jgi:hypothetical protein
MERVNSMPVLRTYCTFKHDYIAEPYLSIITSYKLRSIIARFRRSSHNLEIEVGRHVKQKIPVEKRICKVCTLENVEDEIHMFFQCPAYDTERNFLFKKFDINVVDFKNREHNIMLLKWFMEDEDKIFYVGLYLKKCFNKRSKILDLCH